MDELEKSGLEAEWVELEGGLVDEVGGGADCTEAELAELAELEGFYGIALEISAHTSQQVGQACSRFDRYHLNRNVSIHDIL